MIDKATAIKLYESNFWEGMSAYSICLFQLFEPLLCMPFSVFHGAVEEALKRPLWTHEFASSNIGNLRGELLGNRDAPTFDEIVALIPEHKRLIVQLREPTQ